MALVQRHRVLLICFQWCSFFRRLKSARDDSHRNSHRRTWLFNHYNNNASCADSDCYSDSDGSASTSSRDSHYPNNNHDFEDYDDEHVYESSAADGWEPASSYTDDSPIRLYVSAWGCERKVSRRDELVKYR